MGLLRSSAIGHLTADPVLKSVQIGQDSVSVCEFSVAVNYGFGENKKTEFVNCVAWRKLAEIINEHFAKGRKIYIEGRQQTRKYEDTRFKNDQGQHPMVYRTEWVVDEFDFCDSQTKATSGGGTAYAGQYDAPPVDMGTPNMDAPF